MKDNKDSARFEPPTMTMMPCYQNTSFFLRKMLWTGYRVWWISNRRRPSWKCRSLSSNVYFHLVHFLPVERRSYNRVYKISYEILRHNPPPPPPHHPTTPPPQKSIWRFFAKLVLPRKQSSFWTHFSTNFCTIFSLWFFNLLDKTLFLQIYSLTSTIFLIL